MRVVTAEEVCGRSRSLPAALFGYFLFQSSAFQLSALASSLLFSCMVTVLLVVMLGKLRHSLSGAVDPIYLCIAGSHDMNQI